jgi:hypothetical protein
MEIPDPTQAVFQQPRVTVPQPREQESHPAMGDFRFVPPPEPVSSRLRSSESPGEGDPTKKKSKKEEPSAGGHKKSVKQNPATPDLSRLNREPAAGGKKKSSSAAESEPSSKKSKKETKNYPAVPDLSRLNRGPAEHRDVIPPAVPEAGAPGRPRVRKAKERAEDTEGGKKRRYRNPPDATPHIPYPPAPTPPPPSAPTARRRRATPEGL